MVGKLLWTMSHPHLNELIESFWNLIKIIIILSSIQLINFWIVWNMERINWILIWGGKFPRIIA